MLLAVSPFAAVRAQDAPPAILEAPEGEIPTAPVRIDDQVLFRLRGLSSFPAEERAAVVSARIVAAARDVTITPDAIAVVPSPLGFEIRAGDTLLVTVSPADAAVEAVRTEALAATHGQRIRQAIANYRADRRPQQLLRGVGLSLLATGGLVALLFLTRMAFRKLTVVLEQRVQAHVAGLPKRALPFVQGKQIWDVTRASVRGVQRLLLLVFVFFWLQFVLSRFPWTRALGSNLLHLLLDPLETVATGFLDFVPSLLFLVVLALLTRYGLRLMKLYFSALEHGSMTLGGFEPEWAPAVYRIARSLVIALALVMAYPYLPGSGTEALRGLSVFAGLMLSLGASSAVGNVIAGYFNTFGRVFRVGDIIRVGEVLGEVTQVRLLTTRVRTIKNEEVTIPNSTIITTHLTNYSALAKQHGLILHTEVGIGYAVPWRQVHALLEEAATRTPDLLREPAPFILQKQLGDFAVVYQLNAYSASPHGMARTYSALHQNVLDVFNEHGVQIMTPAYEGDPEQPKVVPREQWYAAPAKPPAERR
jgi:small-conductance mechanosensitive channel